MTNTAIEEKETLPAQETGGPTVLSAARIRTVLSGLMLGIFLAALDQNIVSVAIVRIANSLHGFDQQAWATTAYLITATITTPLYGKLADIYGRKPLYLTSIALFVIGSAACAFATSMYELAGFRAFQGLGAGGLMALAFTILSDIVPPREIVRYQGGFMIVFGVATVLGPVLGGFLSDYDHLLAIDGWRWVFLVNVPIGVIAFAVVARVLNVPHARQDHRIDWFGTITLTACVVPLLIVAEQGREWGWGSHRSLLCYGIGAAGFMLYLIAEFLMKDAALIPLRMFRSSTFSVAILGGTIVGVAMFGVIVLVPLYFQVVRGYSPTRAGLLMLPLVIGIMIGAQLSGMVTRFTGRYKILPVAGSFAFAAGAALFARVEYDSPLWQPLLYCGVIGFGLGGCMQTLIIAAQTAARPEDRGTSTATATFVRQMGGTLGVAVFLTILFNLVTRTDRRGVRRASPGRARRTAGRITERHQRDRRPASGTTRPDPDRIHRRDAGGIRHRRRRGGAGGARTAAHERDSAAGWFGGGGRGGSGRRRGPARRPGVRFGRVRAPRRAAGPRRRRVPALRPGPHPPRRRPTRAVGRADADRPARPAGIAHHRRCGRRLPHRRPRAGQLRADRVGTGPSAQRHRRRDRLDAKAIGCGAARCRRTLRRGAFRGDRRAGAPHHRHADRRAGRGGGLGRQRGGRRLPLSRHRAGATTRW